MAVAARYAHIDFGTTEQMQANARRALEVRADKPKSQRGMTPVGIARARDIGNGKNLAPETWRRVLAYFERHETDKSGETWDEQGPGWQAWMGWGGDAGWARARKIVGQMNAADGEAGLAEAGAIEVRLADALEQPHGLPVAEGLTPGRWLRVASEGPIFDRYTGEKIITLDRALLQDLVTYVNGQAADAPVIIDIEHDGVARGEVVGARFVEDERGPGVEVAPAYNGAALAYIAEQSPSLWTSPSIVGPQAGARDKRTGERVSGAMLRALALTPYPRSPAAGLDRVRLSEQIDSAGAAGLNEDRGPSAALEDAMTPEEIAALQAENESLKAELEAMKAAAMPEDPEAEDAGEKMEAAEAALAEKAQLAEVMQAERDEAKAQSAQLAERVAKLEADLAEREFTAALAEAQRNGYPTTEQATKAARVKFGLREAHPELWAEVTNPATPVQPGVAALGEIRGHGDKSELKSFAAELAEAESAEAKIEAFRKFQQTPEARAVFMQGVK